MRCIIQRTLVWTLLGGLAGMTGCNNLNPLTRIEGLNARRLPDSVLAGRRADLEPIDYVLLRQDPPKDYLLDEDDTLGVYIEGFLGEANQPPPYLADPIGNTPPAVGYPIPLQAGGTLTLPLLKEPLQLKGKTIIQAQEAIRQAYSEQGLIQSDDEAERKGYRILVSLYRPRTYQVLVIREDGGGQLGQSRGNDRSQVREQTFSTERGTGFILDMPAYENDVLRALMETGGLPGNDARAEVRVLKGTFKYAAAKAQLRAEALKNLEACELAPKDSRDPNIVVIPTRLRPTEAPTFTPKDILLGEGDVVVVEERQRDIFYTGGLLGGAEVTLPRDYDLDILAAVAIAGGQIGGGIRFGQGGNFSGFGNGANLRGSTVAASEVTVIREAPGQKQISIKINLRRALADPSQRLLIKPGDVLVLDYTPLEVWENLILNTFPFNTLFDRLIFNR
jgi:hypothetical protein